tara:strand:+ start:193 stop:435 length:243 start_codon:yes stop_codon:yes gene_type:complete
MTQSRKLNKRVFSPKTRINKDLSYSELRVLLKQEQRHDSKAVIKEMIANKIFAKIVFAICILLNVLFVTLATLNYLEIIG